MRVRDVVEIADRIFPFDQAEEWDNCGVQVGDPDAPVTGVAFSLDPTVRTVRFAADRSCELLITHHPLILEPIRAVTPDTLVGMTILEAVRRGVAILSLHTNLDAAPGGLNDHLAARLGLLDVVIPGHARCARLGRLRRPASVFQLARNLAEELDTANVRVIAGEDVQAQRVFCASGSGMGYFPIARRHNADVIVTGDVKYHAAREALELGVPVIDGGHFGLERIAVDLLTESFRKEFVALGAEVRCTPCRAEEDPFAPTA